MEPPDAELLDAYVKGSQAAFAELARRYAGLVYAAARRRLHDPAAVDDVTQAAFMVLAAKAKSLRGRPTVAGWLLVVTRQVAMTANRAADRRRRHERAAARPERFGFRPPADTPDPMAVLDDAIAALADRDRDAITLRYLRNLNWPDVGRALGVGEEAARKRVARATDKLRGHFARRGVALGLGGVTAAVAACVATPAPAAVVARATSASQAAATPLAKGTILMLTAKKVAALSLIGVAVGGTGLLGVVAARTPPHSAIATTAPAPATLPASVPPTQPAGHATGRVRMSDGKPAGGATVTLYGEDPKMGEETIAAAARTAADGTFDVALPAEAVTRISADLPGLGCASIRSFMPGQSAELSFAPPAVVAVTLLDPDGKPAAGVRVWPSLINFGGNTLEERLRTLHAVGADLRRWAVVTDADGVAQFHGLPDGGRLTLATDDARFATMTYEDGVPVEAAAAVAPPPVRLIRAAVIEGRVTYADTGKPAAGITLYAQAADGSPSSFGKATTDPDGRYAIGRLKPGAFSVSLAGASQPPEWCAVAGRFTLREGGHGTADLRLVHGGRIAGHVRDAKTGRGLPGIYVSAYGPAHPKEAGGNQSAETDADGAYVLRVPPGASQVYLSSAPPEGYLSATNANGELKTDTVVADGQTVTRDFDLPPDAALVITGTVVDDTGRPVPGASVQYDASGGNDMNPAVQTDAAGRFRAKVRPNMALRARSGDLATTAAVKVPKRGGDVTLRLARDARFTLDVAMQDESGWTVPTAGVGLTTWHGDFGTGSQPRPADADGHVRFDGLFKDTKYTVQADATGYGPAQANVVSSGPGKAAAELTLTLRMADQVIAGTVVDEAGRPVADVEVGLNGGATGLQFTRTAAQGRFSFAVVRGASGSVFLRQGIASGGRLVEGKAGQSDLVLKGPATRPAG